MFNQGGFGGNQGGFGGDFGGNQGGFGGNQGGFGGNQGGFGGNQGFGNQGMNQQVCGAFQYNPQCGYKIVSARDSSFCLDAVGNYPQKQLVITKFNNRPSQLWRVMEDGMGNYGFLNQEMQGTL